MFTKFYRTNYPPTEKPMMVWDGECGFCKYWVTRWKMYTGDRITYKTYQEVASQFKDIPLKEFKKASRLIEPNGSVYSGPDSAYRSFAYSEEKHWPWHDWYERFPVFTKLSDHSYNFIAKHRSFFYKLTVFCFGKDPKNSQPYWLYYILLILAILCVLWIVL